MFKNMFWLVFGLLWLVGTAAAQEDSSVTINHDDQDRSYQLHVPANVDDPAPLLIALHGFASSGKALEVQSGLNELADAVGMLVAYPDSLGYFWDDGRTRVDYPRGVEPIDDVGLIESIIESVGADHPISEVYLVGHDSGGSLAFRLACEQPDLFAGVAVVSSLMWDYQATSCNADGAAVPMLMIFGSHDPNYQPPEDNLLTQGLPVAFLDVDATLNYWVTRNGCQPESVQQPDEANYIIFTECDAPVIFYSIFGGGNNWYHNSVINPVGVDTSQVVMEFFTGEDLSTQPEAYNNVARDYITFAPSTYEPDQPTPLVVVLHGRPGNGRGQAYLMELNELAEREGFLAVYPDGIDFGWNSMQGLPGFVDQGQDDVIYMQALVVDVAQAFNVDPARVYVIGFSNGGYMSLRLACDATDTFAAVGVISATMPPVLDQVCSNSAPMPIMFLHGTEDQIILFDGQEGMALPVLDMTQYFVQHNGCNPQGDSEIMPPNVASPAQTAVLHFSFYECEGAPVELYVINGGGHNIPGVPNKLNPQVGGLVTLDINASDVLWNFFDQFTMGE